MKQLWCILRYYQNFVRKYEVKPRKTPVMEADLPAKIWIMNLQNTKCDCGKLGGGVTYFGRYVTHVT